MSVVRKACPRKELDHGVEVISDKRVLVRMKCRKCRLVKNNPRLS